MNLMPPDFNSSTGGSVREDNGVRRLTLSRDGERAAEVRSSEGLFFLFQYLAPNNSDASDFTLGSLSNYIRCYSVLQETGALALCVLKKTSYI